MLGLQEGANNETAEVGAMGERIAHSVVVCMKTLLRIVTTNVCTDII